MSVAIDLFADMLYAIDPDYLYLFSKKEPYPTVLNKLKASDTEAQLSLNMVTDSLGRGNGTKTVEVSAVQTVIDKTIIRYFYSIQYPDGSIQYSDQEGGLHLTSAKAITLVPKLSDRISSRTVTIDLPMLGDYIIGLHTQYGDGTSSTDFKLSRLMSKSAISKYKLSRILLDATAVNIFKDFDGTIKIEDTDSYIHTLRFAKDNVLIDYEKSLLYFNEAYDEVVLNE